MSHNSITFSSNQSVSAELDTTLSMSAQVSFRKITSASDHNHGDRLICDIFGPWQQAYLFNIYFIIRMLNYYTHPSNIDINPYLVYSESG